MRHAVPVLIALGLASVTPAAWAADACAVITLDDVTIATGRKDFGRAKPKDGGTSCYYSSPRGSVTVWVVEPQTRKDFDDFRTLLVGQGKAVEDRSGIGDAAYFWDDRLYVHVGTRGLTVQVGPNELKPAAPGEVRAAVLGLALTGVEALR
jgi:hypothetical protein